MNKKSLNFVKKWAKFQTKAQKCSKVHFIRKIWCSNQETGRFDEKLGDSQENRETWQVVLIHILGLQPRDSPVMLRDKILKIIQLYVFPRYGNTYH